MNTLKVRPRNQTNDVNRRTYVAPANYQRPDWIGKCWCIILQNEGNTHILYE